MVLIIHSTGLGDFERVEQKARQMISADPHRPKGHFALSLETFVILLDSWF